MSKQLKLVIKLKIVPTAKYMSVTTYCEVNTTGQLLPSKTSSRGGSNTTRAKHM
jgi:hypothetical protein